MCKKCRVIYKCGHRVTEEMKYCMPWGERQLIADENNECPNDSLSFSINTKELCQRCEDHAEAQKEDVAQGKGLVTVAPSLIQRIMALFKKEKEKKVDLNHTAPKPPKPKPPKPFEHYQPFIARTVERMHKLAEKERYFIEDSQEESWVVVDARMHDDLQQFIEDAEAVQAEAEKK